MLCGHTIIAMYKGLSPMHYYKLKIQKLPLYKIEYGTKSYSVTLSIMFLQREEGKETKAELVIIIGMQVEKEMVLCAKDECER